MGKTKYIKVKQAVQTRNADHAHVKHTQDQANTHHIRRRYHAGRIHIHAQASQGQGGDPHWCRGQHNTRRACALGARQPHPTSGWHGSD